MHYNKVFHVPVIFILFLAMVTSSSGLFYRDDRPFDFVNQYGDTIKIYGNGIYKNFELIY